MRDHYKEICKCGTVVAQCRCPGTKKVTVLEQCNHKWAVDVERELEEQYGIASHVVGLYSQSLQVELSGRHRLDVELTNVYGFVITLSIGDETGGLLKEIDLYSCVGKNNLADTIRSIHASY